MFSKFYQKVTNEKKFLIQNIQSDHVTKFENQDFKKFYDEKRIDHNFSAPRTSRQNGVVKGKIESLKK